MIQFTRKHKPKDKMIGESKRGLAYCRIKWDGGYKENYVTHEFAVVEVDGKGNQSIPHDKAGHVVSVEVLFWVKCEGLAYEPNLPKQYVRR